MSFGQAQDLGAVSRGDTATGNRGEAIARVGD